MNSERFFERITDGMPGGIFKYIDERFYEKILRDISKKKFEMHFGVLCERLIVSKSLLRNVLKNHWKTSKKNGRRISERFF